MNRFVKVGFAALVLAAAIYLYYTEIKPVVIFGLRSDYAHAIPFQPVPAGLTSLKAESCGQCHREIYEEWKTSIHARAYDDPFFQAYWKKDKHMWVCLNCHTPLENQQPTLVKDIPRGRVEKAEQVPNPQYDAEYQKESVTCAACHVRDGVILGPYEDSAAPHPTQFDPNFRTAQVCYRCHNVVSGPAQFYNVGPCGTYAEYEGKFFMQERGFICQSCHMPEIDRPVATNGPIRHGRQHLWRGGHDPDMVKRAIAVQVKADREAVRPGERITFTLTLINAGAGHKIPTGDPDRHFTVEFSVEDKQGTVLERQSATMGRWILWQPAILELYDNRLLPLASRAYEFGYRVPEQAEGLILKTRVQYHILTDGQHEMLRTKYGLTADDPYRFVVYERDFPLSGELTAALNNSDRPSVSSRQRNEMSCQAEG
ncbi:multiheme c-type cytochrome [Nitrospira moscoviensis]|uniref:Putative pentaheme cytochrome c n=1 Tax=Nitrospira moscoviensis TaxID=42253 RepID=A0A0K2GGB1_NITMO|nr:multiheme c-type cytochrome [Nitrospira moscoviensis]ALA59990.1 putative pentaheme cytochrome c [Nitrospira moscoviensis]